MSQIVLLSQMAVKLFYTPGDPDYLKVVLLREVLGVAATCFEVVEGEAQGLIWGT